MYNSITSPNVYTSPATGDGYAVVHAGATRLVGLIATNQTGSTVYVQVHDNDETPDNGDVPVLSLKLTANAQTVLMLPHTHAVALTSGLVVCSSSTDKTLTVGAPTDLFLTVLWV